MTTQEENRLLQFENNSNTTLPISDDITTSFYGIQAQNFSDYTKDEVERIIKDGTTEERIKLSRTFFTIDGFYKRIILTYATLPSYYGVLIPTFDKKQDVSKKNSQTAYNDAMNFITKLNLPVKCAYWAQKVLTDGAYYGIAMEDKNKFTVIDLPVKYCYSDYKDLDGNPIISFDLAYFDKYTNKAMREKILKSFPKIIRKGYKKYKSNSREREMLIYPYQGAVCFTFFDNIPLFLSIIPSILQYKHAVYLSLEKEWEEIKKLVVQKIPHTASGELVFQPVEAESMHKASVNMLKNEDTVSVLTTYADVDAITTKASDNNSNNLDKMRDNIYSSAGVSGQLFASSSGNSLKYSLNNDMALMMFLMNKFSSFITSLLNSKFGKNNISFKYDFLPVAEYNKKDYIDETLKLAQYGYSWLLPAIASGVNQKDIVVLKELETSVLDLKEIMVPLSSSYTQSGDSGSEENKGGAPTKPDDQRADKTIENRESISNQGGELSE